ncbi:MAG: TolC family protein [Gemmatimonadetes bacterium]|nr:TolC family protein [Gemmatimonadota bacterium]
MKQVGILVAVAALAGCASAPSRSPIVQPRALGRDVPVFWPVRNDSGRPATSAPVGANDSLALRDAVAAALLHSPTLAGYAWDVRAREAQLLQVTRFPNPVVGFLAEDVGASPVGSGNAAQQVIEPQTTIQLSQLVELPGKRLARRRMATADRDLAGWDYESARIDLLTRVTQTFVDLLAAQEMVALTTQATATADQVLQSVAARVQAGVASPIEATKADIGLASARIESERATQRLDVVRHKLASEWGAAAPDFAAVRGDLSTVAAPPTHAALAAQLTENPELARWTAEISRRRSALSFESAKRLPDVSVIAGQRTFTELNTDAYVVGASIALPLFDRNQGGTAEAKSLLNKSYEARRAAELRVGLALTTAHSALTTAYREATTLRETILPRSQEAFDAVSEGYRLGRFGLLDVLDAQRTLTSARTQALRAGGEYHKAVAEVERLIGAPLPTVTRER